MTFDEVIPALLGICEGTPGFSTLEAACVARDLRGRVRLVVAPRDTPIDLRDLSNRLSSALGGYFQAPVLSTRGPQEQARLAKNLVQMAEDWPASWSDTFRDPITGTPTRKRDNLWRSFQRLLSKEAWLSGKPEKAPWALSRGAPPVVAFYSFKGGLGRTTLLGAMAWHMARSPTTKRVVVVDLDLEAPGAATLLNAESERGVIDFIVDHVASGATALSGCYGPARALGVDDGARVDVFPAGTMGLSYLEKLARLDYSAGGPGAGEESPVASALKAMLVAIKDELKPDFILVDSRAGLHDLGGLSLHALSHVDVLLSRASRQSLHGLELTVQALARRKDLEEDFRCIVVHSFAPLRKDSETPTEEEIAVRDEAYRIFTDHVYKLQDDVPSATDDNEPHFPSVIFQHSDAERVNTMAEVPETIVFGKDYQALYQRILEQCVPEDEAPEQQEGTG